MSVRFEKSKTIEQYWSFLKPELKIRIEALYKQADGKTFPGYDDFQAALQQIVGLEEANHFKLLLEGAKIGSDDSLGTTGIPYRVIQIPLNYTGDSFVPGATYRRAVTLNLENIVAFGLPIAMIHDEKA